MLSECLSLQRLIRFFVKLYVQFFNRNLSKSITSSTGRMNAFFLVTVVPSANLVISLAITSEHIRRQAHLTPNSSWLSLDHFFL